jgi:hypothetical protein
MKKSFAQTIFCVIRSRPHQLKDSQMKEYQVIGPEHSLVSVSGYEDGVWISVNRHCGYTSTRLTREQAEQLRDALIALTTETEDAAQ